MKLSPKSRFSGLKHVRGARNDKPWTVYHIRTSTLDHRPWLKRDDCARLFIEDLFHYRAELKFLLFAFVVLPEHIHLVMMPTETAGLSKIMMVLKRHSAWILNSRLGRRGHFWHEEFFDHWSRESDQTAKAVGYVHNNPVKRGLVEKPEDYPYSSCLAWIDPNASPYKIDRECFWKGGGQ